MTIESRQSPERLAQYYRRAQIASFISDTLRPAKHALDEAHVQGSAVQGFESRSYQLDAWDALGQARARGSDRGLIHLATGLGKTSVAVFDYARFRAERQLQDKPARGLFVVHQTNILEQASARFREILPTLKRGHSVVELSDPSVEMSFISFQALALHVDKIPEDAFDYIIYDEAHHIEARTYKKVVEHFKPTFQLGLTATPERMDSKDITDHFGKELYSKTLPEAIAEGHLAKVNYNIVSDDTVQEAIDNGFMPSTLAEMQRLFEVQPRNEVIVQKILEAQARIKAETQVDQVKTIIFCADMEHADDIARMMEGSSYHSGKSSTEQNAVLDAFRSNKLDTITVRDMFNEGIDIPDARLIVFLRTTQSVSVFEQQLGRGLRKNKDKTEVTVLDFVANIERMALIKQLAEKIYTLRNPDYEDKDPRETAGLIKAEETGLKVHGTQSEFIFSEKMIDLLEKYSALRPDVPEAPEGWMAYLHLEHVYGLNPYTTSVIAQSLGFEPTLFRKDSLLGRYFSPEQIIQILDSAANRESNRVSREWKTASALRDELGVTVHQIKKITGELGLEPQPKVSHWGKELMMYSPEDQQKIQASVEANFESFKDVPEGWLVAHEVGTLLGGYENSTISRAFRSIGIDGIKITRKGYAAATFYSPEEIKKLEEVLENKSKYQSAQEGYVALVDILKDFSVSDTTLFKIVNDLGLEFEIYRAPSENRQTRYLSPESHQRLKAFFEARDASTAPEDFVTLRQLSIMLGVSESSVKASAISLEIELRKMLDSKNHFPSYHFSPEEVGKIRADILIPVAPQGYMLGKEITESMKWHRGKVLAIATRLGISPTVMRVLETSARKGLYYSPEQVEEIKNFTE